MLKKLLQFDERNSLSSAYTQSVGDATWNNWDLINAVDGGYKVNSWTYIAVRTITRAASSVPWVVFNADGEAEYEHPLSLLLDNPNPAMNRQDVMELIIGWLELTGQAYLHCVKVGNNTRELWPISPKRIEPVASNDPSRLIGSYKLDRKISSAYTPENIIYFRFIDPSNPIGGIGPLQVAAKAVDIDIEQQEWNKAAMQNRGVIDGVYTIKTPVSEPVANTIWEKIKERYHGKNNARGPGLFNGDVTYTRTAMTPAEADFHQSRMNNRDEILAVFGVPAILVGALEASTYNNYQTSLKILWSNTIIPLLDDIKDTLNHSLKSELPNGGWIGYDTSSISALREDEDAKIKTAATLWKMGVPVSVLNEKYELGLSEFPGWMESWGGNAAPSTAITQTEQNSPNIKLREYRNIDSELKKRDEIAEFELMPSYVKQLTAEKKKIFEMLDEGGDDIKKKVKAVIEDNMGAWEEIIDAQMRKVIPVFAGQIVEGRAEPSLLEKFISAAIEKYIVAEKSVLATVTKIAESTIDSILLQIASGIKNGSAISVIQQAIIDSGIFEPSRALRIARTEAGSAQSIGQIAAAGAGGAKNKTWVSASFGVRDLHQKRNGVTVPFNGTWDKGIRFPLDPKADAADRINCRCSMTFSV